MSGVCLIVGTARGIGRAQAIAFAKQGYDIAFAGSHSEGVTSILSDVSNETGRRAQAYPVNLSSERSVDLMIKSVEADMGHIDVAIYNAASATQAEPTLLSVDGLEADLRITLLGALTVAQQVAPAMRERGRGSILFTGSGFAIEPSANWASLGIGKAALRNLSFALAKELGKSGIHVATVTIQGVVQDGSTLDSNRIADAYVELHGQAQGQFDVERVLK